MRDSLDIRAGLFPGRYAFSTLVLPTLCINILSLALPFLTLQVYDRILPNPDGGTLSVLIAGILVAIMLETVLRMGRAYVMGWSSASFEHRTSVAAIRQMMNAELSAVNQMGTGEALNRLAAVGKIKDFQNGSILVTVIDALFIPVYLAAIIYIAGGLVLIPVAILTLFIISSVFHGVRLKAALHDREEDDDARYNFLIETLQGIHTLKSFALEKVFQRRYEKIQYNTTLANYAVTEETAKSFNSANVFASLIVAAVIAGGAWMVVTGRMSSGGMIAAILLSGRLMLPAQKVLGLWIRYQDYQVARDKINTLLHMPQVARDQSVETPMSQGIVELRSVGFRYTDASPWLFRDVDLALHPGQAIRISGAHGAGKTALLKLIVGLYRPQEGEVLVDGVHPSVFPDGHLLSHIGYIPTKGTLFRGRIRDNLTRFGMVPESDVRAVTAMLGIDRDVSALPKGFDTWVEGTENDVLPPGLRQRIAIARALAGHPKVILFDDADRNLDRDGYRAVHTMLGRLKHKASIIMVSDDRNMTSLCDRHYRLDINGLIPQMDERTSLYDLELRA
ncbi:peptidase domain-containing ABC transporter [Micavibrio aeruginosavorus]|uniref:peptidase domain-containing ABC transporter n=1 Tax=Micavibrio aeruginosavorus TaxID=349221 RepID=UPI003F4AF23A